MAADIYNGGNYSDPILKIGDTILNGGPSGENIYNESGTDDIAWLQFEQR